MRESVPVMSYTLGFVGDRHVDREHAVALVEDLVQAHRKHNRGATIRFVLQAEPFTATMADLADHALNAGYTLELVGPAEVFGEARIAPYVKRATLVNVAPDRTTATAVVERLVPQLYKLLILVGEVEEGEESDPFAYLALERAHHRSVPSRSLLHGLDEQLLTEEEEEEEAASQQEEANSNVPRRDDEDERDEELDEELDEEGDDLEDDEEEEGDEEDEEDEEDLDDDEADEAEDEDEEEGDEELDEDEADETDEGEDLEGEEGEDEADEEEEEEGDDLGEDEADDGAEDELDEDLGEEEDEEEMAATTAAARKKVSTTKAAANGAGAAKRYTAAQLTRLAQSDRERFYEIAASFGVQRGKGQRVAVMVQKVLNAQATGKPVKRTTTTTTTTKRTITKPTKAAVAAKLPTKAAKSRAAAPSRPVKVAASSASSSSRANGIVADVLTEVGQALIKAAAKHR